MNASSQGLVHVPRHMRPKQKSGLALVLRLLDGRGAKQSARRKRNRAVRAKRAEALALLPTP